jgi:acyl-CoA thioester hydrolase
VWSPLDELEPILYAKAATTIVLVDAESGRPRRITDRERGVWGEYVEDPIVFKS